MRLFHFSTILALTLAAGAAAAQCTPLRMGYTDQHRPPYYLGTGNTEAAPAGAGAAVDVMREAAAAAGCELSTVRLPMARLRGSLRTGAIDTMPMEANESDKHLYALPLDAKGNLDVSRALRVHVVVFVRASDKALRNIDPAREFGQRWLGANHAVPLVAPLRQRGFRVDDGALDSERNFEKLMRKRIDGYAVSLAAPGDMDQWVAAKYGDAIVRLERPLQTNNIWLAMSKDYQARHPAEVDAMWRWAAENGRQRFARLIRIYLKQMAQPGG